MASASASARPGGSAEGDVDGGDLLAVRVAELYYDEDRTQDEIGAELGLTRWKVGRLLAFARERGIVRIEIVHPRARRGLLERELRARFGLADAVVVPSDGTDDPQDRAAHAAADYLAALHPAPASIGVSWGRTLAAVAAHLPAGWADGVDVVQVNGGVSLTTSIDTAAATATSIASKGGGTATLLPTPAVFERAETQRALSADRTVARVLERAASADVYLYSAGVADASSALVESGYLTPADLRELRERGAVGDVIGRYIDAAGAIVDPALDDRTIGLDLEVLRTAAIAIAVVAGTPKREVARAIAASRLCTVLVTDELTARFLMEETP